MSKNDSKISCLNDFAIIHNITMEPVNCYTSQVYAAKRVIDLKLYRMYMYYLNDYWGNIGKNEKIQNLIKTLNKIISATKGNDNMLQFKDSFIDNKTNKLVLITEYTNDTVYNNLIQKGVDINRAISEDRILNIIKDITGALAHLHKNNIYNINLSSNNVFLMNSNIKLNPYSFINEKDNNTNDIVCPEVAHGKRYNEKSDIWYLGLLIYEICSLTKMKRTSIDNLNEMYSNIIKGNYTPIPEHYSKNMREIIKMCLQFTPERRPSAEEILRYIQSMKAKKILNSKIQIFKLNKEMKNNKKNFRPNNIKDYNRRLLTEQSYKKEKKKNVRAKSVNLSHNDIKHCINIQNSHTKNHLECIQKKKVKQFVIENANNICISKDFNKKRSVTPNGMINQDILDLNAYLKFGNMQSVNILNNGFGYKDLSQINQRYSNQ